MQQNGLEILESGDTALMLAKTLVSAPNLPATEGQATYAFARDCKGHRTCSIDNSYGHEIVLTNT